jgi:hypothetical protein
MSTPLVYVLVVLALEPAKTSVKGWDYQVPGGGILHRLELSCLATVESANRKAVGNSLPRFSARRRMPLQARLLKKYRRGRSPVSKMSDNEDATPSLGNSEVLSVKNSVGPPIPEFDQPSEYGTKVPSFS